MLGNILAGLTDAARAQAVMAAVAPPELVARIAGLAAAEGAPVGVAVATRVRHVIEHGGEALWLDLLGLMSESPQPGAAAVERVLAKAFADPPRAGMTRRAA